MGYRKIAKEHQAVIIEMRVRGATGKEVLKHFQEVLGYEQLSLSTIMSGNPWRSAAQMRKLAAQTKEEATAVVVQEEPFVPEPIKFKEEIDLGDGIIIRARQYVIANGGSHGAEPVVVSLPRLSIMEGDVA